jgi:hypothetical protein
MSSLDYVSLALAAIKDKVRQETAEEFRKSYTKLLETEAQTRRSKVQADILEMSKLSIELSKFEQTYNQIKSQCGTIESVENYILEIRKRIRLISENKNKPLINRQ